MIELFQVQPLAAQCAPAQQLLLCKTITMKHYRQGIQHLVPDLTLGV